MGPTRCARLWLSTPRAARTSMLEFVETNLCQTFVRVLSGVGLGRVRPRRAALHPGGVPRLECCGSCTPRRCSAISIP